MKRIAVVSDSHGDFRRLERARELLGPVDLLIHAGDHFQDAGRIAAHLGLDATQVRAVVGNCDHPLFEPVEDLLDIEGVRVLVTHGHLFGVKRGVERVYFRAREAGARVVIFGHSHVALNVEDNGVLLLNPGSLSAPHLPQDPPSCALLEIDQGAVRTTILSLAG